MKKVLISLLLLMLMTNSFACINQFYESQIEMKIKITKPGDEQGDPHKSPVVIPSVSLDDHTLYFDTPCDGCTLNIVDENDVVVYTLVIPTGTTSLVLPSSLTGEYELQIIQGVYCFYGTITL